MVATLLAVLLVQSPQDPVVAPSPSALLTKTIARYADAKTVRGTITMSQSAKDKTVRIETVLQTEKPAKVYLKQAQKGGDSDTCLLTSDGRSFSFDPIQSNVLRMKRGEEPLVGPDGTPVINVTTGLPLGLPDIYIAMNDRLVDKNIWLDMVFGEKLHMKSMLQKWASLLYRGRHKVRNVDVHAISGAWRELPTSAPGGDFEIYINDQMEVLRYVVTQRVAVPNVQDPIEVQTIWDADLAVDGPVDPALFRVVR
ncbi:MAG TPA: hypothetical protein VGE01_09070 [Fimbriimonas sp.]